MATQLTHPNLSCLILYLFIPFSLNRHQPFQPTNNYPDFDPSSQCHAFHLTQPPFSEKLFPNQTKILVQSPETGFLHYRSCLNLVWSHSVHWAKQKIRFYTSNLKYFTIFCGPSEKCKALYSVRCILVSIVNVIQLLCSMCWTGQELVLSAADLGFGFCWKFSQFYTFALLNVLNWTRTAGSFTLLI
jgi:hypothetical protein